MKGIARLMRIVSGALASFLVVGFGCTPGRLYGPAPERPNEIPDGNPAVLDGSANNLGETPEKVENTAPVNDVDDIPTDANREEIETIYGPPEMFGLPSKNEEAVNEDDKNEALPESGAQSDSVEPVPVYGMPMVNENPVLPKDVEDPEEDVRQLREANKPNRPVVTKYGIRPVELKKVDNI